VNCPTCNTNNPDLARFCLNCGEALAAQAGLVCPQCGGKLQADANYCTACGCPMGKASGSIQLKTGFAPPAGFLERMIPKEYLQQLLTAKGRLAGERRIVTILFFDIVDSTGMAESLDPEDVLEVMNGAFEVLVEPIYRYEGTLARLMGDGVLSFFGAPIAHEDDPIRACHAALGIVERAREYADLLKRLRGIDNFEVRVGINTGLVVVGEVGADLRVEYTAMGDAVNLAARMESAAAPGTIVISDNTHRLVKTVFGTEDLGHIQAKGKTDPVHVYRLIRQKSTSPSVKPISHVWSPLVGRAEELGFLQNKIDGLNGGSGGAIAISGKTGLGKTRLISEARHTLPDDVLWGEGRCTSYSSGISYWVIQEILRGLLGVDLLTDPDEVKNNLNECLNQLSAGSEDVHTISETASITGLAPELYPYLARLLGLPTDATAERDRERAGADELRRRISSSFCGFVRSLARIQPVVLAWENLHWADPYSLEILESLLPVSKEVPLLLVLSFRPDDGPIQELHERAQQQLGDDYRVVPLRPLDRSESVSLLRNLVGGKAIPDNIVRAILKSADGNAFYLEEVLRSLLEAGLVVVDGDRVVTSAEINTIDVPTTVQAAIMSRVDRLNPKSKRTLQTASVIGRVFPRNVLSRIVGDDIGFDQVKDSLEELRLRDFVRTRAESDRVSGEAKQSKKNPTGGKAPRFDPTRYQTSLGGIVLDESVYVFNHSMAADVVYNSLLKSQRKEMHKRTGSVIEELFPKRLEEAAPLLAYHFDKGAVAEKAFEYMVKGARRAARVYANQEAVDRYLRALTFGDAVPKIDVAQAHEALGDVYFVMSEYQAAAEQFDAALKSNDDRSRRVTLNRKKGQLFEKWGKHEESKSCFETAAGDLQDPIDTTEAARIYSGLAMILYHQNDLDRAVEQAKLALDMMDSIDDRSGIAEACNNLGVIYCRKSEWDSAIDCLEKSRSICEVSRDPYGLAASLNNLGLAHHRRGDLDQAAAYFERGLEIFERIGNRHGLARSYDNLGQVYMDKEEREKAMDYLKKAVAILAEISVDKDEIEPEMWQSGAW
jgi:class 3 adenylate cyclase/predicted ATPase